MSFWRDMYKVVANGDVWQNTVCNRSKQGELYWVDTTIVPFKGEDGKPFSYISIRTDVTAKRQAEIERLRAIEQAERASQAKTEFISSMSHELRTPLNSIMGFTQLMLLDTDTPLNSTQKENAEYVLSSGNYLLELVNQILDLAKIEKGEDTFHIEEVSLTQVIHEVVEVASIAATKANITLNVASELAISLQTDRTKLRQILTNLIDNAIKYSESGGNVTIDWSIRHHDAVKVTVTDTGIGIPLEKQHELFSAFNRLGKENSAILGTGIGLVITKKLVESLDGEIGFESTENKGSLFWFSLPLPTQR
jgi:signal transduction histidine kinase